MKLNLSRAAKKFTSGESKQPAAAKPARSRKPARPLVPTQPEPVVEEKVDPVVAPVAQAVEPAREPVIELAPVPEPRNAQPVKVKRPRFVFVRRKAEGERSSVSPLPPPSTKLAARLMTRNLALPPKDEAARFGR